MSQNQTGNPGNETCQSVDITASVQVDLYYQHLKLNRTSSSEFMISSGIITPIQASWIQS